MTKIWDFASYNLWSLFSPPVGREEFHCDMKRGFSKARKKEPQVKALLEQDNIHQKIGIWAQKGVYELHNDPLMLYQTDPVKKVIEILQLNQESTEVQKRVTQILKNYLKNPLPFGKKIIELNRGDEGYPEPIVIKQAHYSFNLYAAIDCIFQESDGTIHILDFKTGKSDFDKRQGYVYLLAASYLYPNKKAVASFYNIETGKLSEPITASKLKLQALQIELAKLAKQHQQDLKNYRQNQANFSRIFPPNPGLSCHYCPFNSICQFSVTEVAV